jgi:hypothetical protein
MNKAVQDTLNFFSDFKEANHFALLRSFADAIYDDYTCNNLFLIILFIHLKAPKMEFEFENSNACVFF